MARPVKWDHDGPAPLIYLAPDKKKGYRGPTIGIGDRVLARLKRLHDGSYQAEVMKRVGAGVHKILGVVTKEGNGTRVLPVDRRSKHDLLIAKDELNGAKAGELVLAELLPTRGYGPKMGRIIERLCRMDEPKAISLIAIHAHNIPVDFPQAVQKAVDMAKPVSLGKRTDLRELPLITIDPKDARDHDDAVHAARDESEDNKGGFIIHVAIADVAHYVRPGEAWIPKPCAAAIRFTSPTGLYPCCRSGFPTIFAPYARAKKSPALPCAWCLTNQGARNLTSSSAH